MYLHMSFTFASFLSLRHLLNIPLTSTEFENKFKFDNKKQEALEVDNIIIWLFCIHTLNLKKINAGNTI